MTKIKEADLHVTMECGSKCPYCYRLSSGAGHTPFECGVVVGETETLKRAITSFQQVAGAEDLVFVGGDPCLHPDIVSLLRRAKTIGLNTCVLSNTHVYRDGGKEIPIEDVAPFVDEVDFTLHGVPHVHEIFNGTKGSYALATSQIKRYAKVRSPDQAIGIVLNMVPTTIGTFYDLYDIMSSVALDLCMEPGRDFFTIQRIAPSGQALECFTRWEINQAMVCQAFDMFDLIKNNLGIETKVCIDAFPWCAVPEKYWHYLEPLKGGCNWGQPNGVLSALPNGELQRCALCHDTLGVNILSLDSPEAFSRFMEENSILKAVREHRHLDDRCLQCPLLDRCGGGCIIANGKRDPYAGNNPHPHPGHDYLATQRPLV